MTMAASAYARATSFLPANCARTYTVRSGDFCEAISASQHVSTFQLANVNKGIIDVGCDNLFAGEVLCLGITGQDCQTVHVVQGGETCDSIAANAGINEALLAANNPNIDKNCDNLGSGEVLCTAWSLFV
ncbi:hypothetical protein QCA50_008406 [Cerrena zonata]|uniref:LysM domain-containing protein n=1 Tax=Cerrena zonata TaxID=2478898 RepID=A0AAW0GEL3_9APHY